MSIVRNAADVEREVTQQLTLDINTGKSQTPVPKNASRVPVPKPSLWKRAGAALSATFRQMCIRHEKIRAQIKLGEAQIKVIRERNKKHAEELAQAKNRIGTFCDRHGVTVRTEDRAFYSHPWKAQVEIKRNSDMMSEPIRQWAAGVIGMTAQLFLPDDNGAARMNVEGLRRVISSDKIQDPALRTQLLKSLDALMTLARANDLVEESEAVLDLEAYDKLKANGLIPAEICQAAEQDATYFGVVSVDKIINSKDERCAGCSEVLPKRRPAGHQCKRCGTAS